MSEEIVTARFPTEMDLEASTAGECNFTVWHKSLAHIGTQPPPLDGELRFDQETRAAAADDFECCRTGFSRLLSNVVDQATEWIVLSIEDHQLHQTPPASPKAAERRPVCKM